MEEKNKPLTPLAAPPSSIWQDLTSKPPIDSEKRTQIYIDYLGKEGYKPSIDSDGDVVFKREGRTLYIMIDKKDPDFFRLLLIRSFDFKDEAERAKAIDACNETNKFVKMAKVYAGAKWISMAVELFLVTPDAFEPIFERMCQVIFSANAFFAEKMEGRDEKAKQ